MINDIDAGIEFIADALGEIPSTIDDLLKIIQNQVDGGIGDIENLIGQIVSALDGIDLPPNLQELVDQIKQILGDQQPQQPIGSPAATLPAPAPTTPSVGEGNDM